MSENAASSSDEAQMDTLLAEMQFKASVLRGSEQARRGEGISQAELEDRLERWRQSSERRNLSGK